MLGKKQLPSGNILLVLIVATLALTLAAVVTGISLNQLSLSAQSEGHNRIEAGGESVCVLVLEELQNDPEFGDEDHSGRSRLFEWRGSDGEIGLLTFDPSVAATEGIEVSINNFSGDVAKDGVPAGHILLRGNGSWGDTSRGVVELMVAAPPYPTAIGAAGSISLDEASVVGQLPAGGDPARIQVDELLPAHVRSGANVDLDSGVIIQGDVMAGRDIALNGADVRGNTLANAGPFDPPTISLSTLEPTDFKPVSPTFTGGNNWPNRPLTGYNLCDIPGGLLLVQDGLYLSDAVLYVDGDIHVQKGVHGNGAVVATGNITVEGNSKVVQKQRMALAAGGELVLLGSASDPEAAVIQGTLYAGGDVTCKFVRVGGVVVAGGGVTLHQATVAEANGAVDLSVRTRGFHRSLGTGEVVNDFGAGNVSTWEEARLIAPDIVLVTLWSKIPGWPMEEEARGTVNISTGQILSGDTDPGGVAPVNRILTAAIRFEAGPPYPPDSTESYMQDAAIAESVADHYMAAVADRHYDQTVAWLEGGDFTKPPEENTGSFTFDVNEFLPMADRLKVLTRRVVRETR